jgi:hypothetical protein
VAEIDIAIKARIEWIKMTTPGASKPKDEAKPLGGLISKIVSRRGTKVYGD